MRPLLAAALALAAPAARADDTPRRVELAGLTGTAPAAWKQEEPSNSMRLTQFRIPNADGDKADAELAVFVFPGGSGTLKQNLDRQLAKFLDDGRTATDEKVKVGPIEATLQDVAGTYKKKPFPMATDFTKVPDYRQLYVVFEAADKKQYYMTLLGPKATVEKNKKAFTEFLASFK